MKRYKYFLITGLSVFVSSLFMQENCNAIPAFARKYQISCQVCHSPAIPRLKAFGEEFANNGFRMTKYESPRYFIETGDDRLSLFRELPLAIRLDGNALANFDNSGKTEFATPFVLKLLSGGELSDKLSYYFYFLMNEEGSIVGVEDAFLMYRDLFKTGINFYVGQFQASDPLFKSELRYTLEEYKIYDAAPGNSSATLKYERGIMIEKPFSTGTTVQLEVLNGCGIDKPVFDIDKYKNFMLRISQSIGKKVSVGLFAYTGKEVLSDPGFIYSDITNNLKMFGPDIKINFDEKLILNLQLAWRSDSGVFPESGGLPEEDVKTNGGFAEIIYGPKGDMSKWYLTGLYNWVNSDIDDIDYQAITMHAGYLLRRNLRLVSEYTYQLSGDPYGRVNVGFVSAF